MAAGLSAAGRVREELCAPAYRCFDAAGSCTRDITRFFSEGVVTDCWQNGAASPLQAFMEPGPPC